MPSLILTLRKRYFPFGSSTCGDFHPQVIMSSALPPCSPVHRTFKLVSMSGRRTHKINFTAPYFPDSSQICDKPFVLIPFRSHPSGTVRPICGKGRNKILRTTTCLIFHWLDKHRSRSTGRINRIRLNFFPSHSPYAKPQLHPGLISPDESYRLH